MKLQQVRRILAVPFRYAFYVMQNHVGKCTQFKLLLPETRTTMQNHFCIILQLKFGNLYVSEGPWWNWTIPLIRNSNSNLSLDSLDFLIKENMLSYVIKKENKVTPRTFHETVSFTVCQISIVC